MTVTFVGCQTSFVCDLYWRCGYPYGIQQITITAYYFHKCNNHEHVKWTKRQICIEIYELISMIGEIPGLLDSFFMYAR